MANMPNTDPVRAMTADEAMRALAERPCLEVLYLGAMFALQIKNKPIARELAECTRTLDEAAAAIEIMRAARPGDRVWPALEFLRQRRAGS